MVRHTHTVALLEVSREAYQEIAEKLLAANYAHVFDGEIIDMTGIGLIKIGDDNEHPAEI